MYLVSKVDTFAKLFFMVSLSGLLMYVALAFYTFHSAYTNVSKTRRTQEKIEMPDPDDTTRSDNDLKYILLWTVSKQTFNPLGNGQEPFIENKCSHINCFLTTDKELLNGDYTHFDAVILNVSILARGSKKVLPQKRNFRQKYIFYGKEPSRDRPVCGSFADNYFNWTWSYKLYSDIFSPFFEFKDLQGNVVAPRPEVNWASETFEVKQIDPPQGKTKHLALIWDDRTCKRRLNKSSYVQTLKLQMKNQGLIFDIYGCGNLPCPNGTCIAAVKRDYYFYLVYEDSLCEDYLTGEILKAYQNDAVPIIVSGADLSKFVPPNSFVPSDQDSTEDKIASILDYSVRNPAVFSRFNRWKSYYTVHEVESTRGLCDLCRYLNDAKMMNLRSNYEYFRKWWYQGPLMETCVPNSRRPDIKELTSYYNNSRGI